jgi:hypothetical protein
VPAVAAAVVTSEIAAAILVVPSRTSLIGLSLAVGVLALFSGVVAFAVVTGRETRCECFGSQGSTLGIRHLVRNGVLVTLGAAGIVAEVQTRAPNASNAGAMLAIATGLVIGATATRWDDIVFVLLGEPSSSV